MGYMNQLSEGSLKRNKLLSGKEENIWIFSLHQSKMR